MLKLIREIKSKLGVLHFQRLRILETKWFSIFIHKIYKSDQDKYQHDHPYNFLSIILSGGYIEKSKKEYKRVLWWTYNKAERPHKLRLIKLPTITLVFTGQRFREWGFYTDRGFMTPDKRKKHEEFLKRAKNKKKLSIKEIIEKKKKCDEKKKKGG